MKRNGCSHENGNKTPHVSVLAGTYMMLKIINYFFIFVISYMNPRELSECIQPHTLTRT